MRKPAKPQDDLPGLLLERTLHLVRQDGRDFSLRQLAVLLVCDVAEDPQTIRGLAQYLSIVKPSVTRAVDRLEHAGLVKRKIDPADRRSVFITMTDAGSDYCTSYLGIPRKSKHSARSREKA